MSKQVISSTKITKSYQITKSSQDYNENQQNLNNQISDSIAQGNISNEFQKQITGQASTYINQSQMGEYSKNFQNVNRTSNKNEMFKNFSNNLDSSTGAMQHLSANNQSICTCGKWKSNTHSTYNNTIQTNLTGDGYDTYDEAKKRNIKCTCYNRNTNRTVNNKLSLNDQNIFIQDGSSSDYCTCGERERKVFSFASSELNENIPQTLTDEENNPKICTCGQNHQNTIKSNDGKKTRIINNRNIIQYSSNIINTSNNDLPVQTTDYEDRETIKRKEVKKVINEEINIEVIRKQVREKIIQELNEEREQNEGLITWNGENFIQVMERLQFLTAPPPELSVQFLNDMMIKKTINTGPIHVLIPIPDNHIQKQGIVQVLSEQKEKKEEDEKNPNEDLCPENVDLLNISHAYSIPVPSFNNLEIENSEMKIEGVPRNIDNGNEKDNFVIENYGWDIDASERMWSGVMRPVRVNKLEIEVPTRPDWNNVLEKELVSDLNLKVKGKSKKEKVAKSKSKDKLKGKKKDKKDKKSSKNVQKKVEKIYEKIVEKNVEEKPEQKEESEPEEEQEEEPEEEPEQDIEEVEEVVEEEDEVEDIYTKRERQKRKAEIAKRKREKEAKKRKKDPKRFRKNKFTIVYKQNKKRFKTIDIGDNEVITLKAVRTILEPGKKRHEKIIKQTEAKLFLGGKGFDESKFKWNPVPFNAHIMTIDRIKKESPLENVAIDRVNMPAANKRRQDWNKVNNLSSESTINILTKEKIYSQERVEALTTIGEATGKNKWAEKIRKQKGVKLGYGPSKKWDIKICKEIDMLFEQEADDVIINDDYNNVKGPEMRPIHATIIKVNEEEETSSVTSYDVFQNVIVKNSNIEYGFGVSKSLGGKGSLEIGFANGASRTLKNKNYLDFAINSIGGLEKNKFGSGFGGGLGAGSRYGDIPGAGGASGFSYHYEFNSSNDGVNSSQKKNGFQLGMGGEKTQQSNYEFKFKGPSFGKKVTSQTKLVATENSTGNIMESNSGNVGISINKVSENLNVKSGAERERNMSSFSSFGEQGSQNMIRLRVKNNSEKEQKNKYDKTVKSLASQTKSLIGNRSTGSNRNSKKIMEKRKKIEFIREEPDEQTNYLKI